MALITRLSRLFRADLHAVLDRVEEPQTLLRQAVRDMQEELAQAQQRCALLAHEDTRLGNRLQESDTALLRLEEELDLCFANSKETLARALVKRKLELQRLQITLGAKRSALCASRATLTTWLEENHERLDAMRQNLDLISAEDTQASSQEPWELSADTVSSTDVEVAFVREQQKRCCQ